MRQDGFFRVVDVFAFKEYVYYRLPVKRARRVRLFTKETRKIELNLTSGTEGVISNYHGQGSGETEYKNFSAIMRLASKISRRSKETMVTITLQSMREKCNIFHTRCPPFHRSSDTIRIVQTLRRAELRKSLARENLFVVSNIELPAVS